MFCRYIAKPYLINQTKFDLRLYVLITSINPLRIYLYDDGLVRFASKPYSSSTSTAADVFTHLTNYSINKQSASYLSNEDSRVAQVRREYREHSELKYIFRDTSGLFRLSGDISNRLELIIQSS
jgi:hypothetical protein